MYYINHKYLAPVWNKSNMGRSRFIKRALNRGNYYDGLGEHKNNYAIWDLYGDPDIIIIRIDGKEIAFKKDKLYHAYKRYIKLDIWVLAIISVDNDDPDVNYCQFSEDTLSDDLLNELLR